MSMLSRWSNVSLATFRIACCDIDANSAFLNSPKSVVKTLAAPSDDHSGQPTTTSDIGHRALTSGNGRAGKYPDRRTGCDWDIQAVHNVFEEERHLNIEHFSPNQQCQRPEHPYLRFGRVARPYILG
jgi:hypothetical protein